ncbi:MAG TPA: biotin/lipoyl-binding protein, partial [Planctomycetaceae bacterium]|nr:biotin/lipoyl-binding protein [Planctomycetaceae bacterium]
MSRQVDLSQLAIERTYDLPTEATERRRWLSRYVLPLAIVGGLLALAGWAGFDLVFPPVDVTVVPIHATKTVEAGETLFKTAGWVEPRPTAIRVAALAPGVVEKLLVVEDQPVEAGEPIAELIKDDAQLAFERAQADVKLKTAELQQSEAALAAAKTRFEQPVHLEAPLREAEAMLAKMETLLTNLPFEIRRAEADYKFARI